jgi:hypothetical protein
MGRLRQTTFGAMARRLPDSIISDHDSQLPIGHNVDRLARDMAAFRPQLTVGLSAGGKLLLEVLCRHPELRRDNRLLLIVVPIKGSIAADSACAWGRVGRIHGALPWSGVWNAAIETRNHIIWSLLTRGGDWRGIKEATTESRASYLELHQPQIDELFFDPIAGMPVVTVAAEGDKIVRPKHALYGPKQLLFGPEFDHYNLVIEDTADPDLQIAQFERMVSAFDLGLQVEWAPVPRLGPLRPPNLRRDALTPLQLFRVLAEGSRNPFLKPEHLPSEALRYWRAMIPL